MWNSPPGRGALLPKEPTYFRHGDERAPPELHETDHPPPGQAVQRRPGNPQDPRRLRYAERHGLEFGSLFATPHPVPRRTTTRWGGARGGLRMLWRFFSLLFSTLSTMSGVFQNINGVYIVMHNLVMAQTICPSLPPSLPPTTPIPTPKRRNTRKQGEADTPFLTALPSTGEY
jgi:hypothetical protein